MLQPLGENNFNVDLRCAWKGKGPKLFTPIASNKNGQESNKNLETMIKATKAQFLRQAIGAITSKEINPRPPLNYGGNHLPTN